LQFDSSKLEELLKFDKTFSEGEEEGYFLLDNAEDNYVGIKIEDNYKHLFAST